MGNNFGRSWNFNDIRTRIQKTSSLYHAITAVGALDLSRKPLSYIQTKEATMKAITAYNISITQFQLEIDRKDAHLSDITLWTTLFLGLFEVSRLFRFFVDNFACCNLIIRVQLMYDKTGEGWLKHILYGTSKILQLRGPKACLYHSGPDFYLTVRVFEICRAIIYSEPTFLSQPKWMSLNIAIRRQDIGSTLHPKEHLFDLMIKCSTLSQQ